MQNEFVNEAFINLIISMNKEISTEVSSDRFRVSAFVRMRDSIAVVRHRQGSKFVFKRDKSLK